jgi:hypothetical protein
VPYLKATQHVEIDALSLVNFCCFTKRRNVVWHITVSQQSPFNSLWMGGGFLFETACVHRATVVAAICNTNVHSVLTLSLGKPDKFTSFRITSQFGVHCRETNATSVRILVNRCCVTVPRTHMQVALAFCSQSLNLTSQMKCRDMPLFARIRHGLLWN